MCIVVAAQWSAEIVRICSTFAVSGSRWTSTVLAGRLLYSHIVEVVSGARFCEFFQSGEQRRGRCSRMEGNLV